MGKSAKIEDARPITFKFGEKGAAQEAKDRLITRVEAYWQANAEGDLYAMFEFLLPENREKMGFRKFSRRKRVLVTGYAVDRAVLWGDQCSAVKTMIRMETESMSLGQVPMRQRWVLEEGEWYLFMSPEAQMVAMFGLGRANEDGPCPLPDEFKSGLIEKEKVAKEQAKTL